MTSGRRTAIRAPRDSWVTGSPHPTSRIQPAASDQPHPTSRIRPAASDPALWPTSKYSNSALHTHTPLTLTHTHSLSHTHTHTEVEECFHHGGRVHVVTALAPEPDFALYYYAAARKKWRDKHGKRRHVLADVSSGLQTASSFHRAALDKRNQPLEGRVRQTLSPARRDVHCSQNIGHLLKSPLQWTRVRLSSSPMATAEATQPASTSAADMRSRTKEVFMKLGEQMRRGTENYFEYLIVWRRLKWDSY